MKGPRHPTDFAELRRRIRSRGYDVRIGGKHPRITRPNGSLLMGMPSTPSDHRSLMNAWKQFLRMSAADSARKTG